jgi:hypothetical protein
MNGSYKGGIFNRDEGDGKNYCHCEAVECAEAISDAYKSGKGCLTAGYAARPA